MTEWGVVGVIIALVGLGLSVAKPILTLNASIVKLTERLVNLADDLDKLSDTNIAAHKRIWERIDEHGKSIQAQNDRIYKIEMKIERDFG